MMEWKSNDRGVELLRLGRFTVAKAYYDGATSRSDPRKYRAMVLLPGAGDDNALTFQDLDEAKARCEARVTWWLAKAGLTSTDVDVRGPGA